MVALTKALMMNPMQTVAVDFPLQVRHNPGLQGLLDCRPHDKLTVIQSTCITFKQHFD